MTSREYYTKDGKQFCDWIGSPVTYPEVNNLCTCGGTYSQLHGIDNRVANVLSIAKNVIILSCSCCKYHTKTSSYNICTDVDCCPFYAINASS